MRGLVLAMVLAPAVVDERPVTFTWPGVISPAPLDPPDPDPGAPSLPGDESDPGWPDPRMLVRPQPPLPPRPRPAPPRPGEPIRIGFWLSGPERR